MTHLDDERLLQWILDPASRDDATRARLEADQDASRRLAELEGFVTSCRSLVGASEEETAPGPLAERVLARTTREDLSWRGDLRLFAGFVRRRMSHSAWLRLAAASLVLHLLALPALAFYVLVVQPEGPRLGLIPWEEYRPELPYPDERTEPERPLGGDPALDEDVLDEVRGGSGTDDR